MKYESSGSNVMSANMVVRYMDGMTSRAHRSTFLAARRQRSTCNPQCRAAPSVRTLSIRRSTVGGRAPRWMRSVARHVLLQALPDHDHVRAVQLAQAMERHMPQQQAARVHELGEHEDLVRPVVGGVESVPNLLVARVHRRVRHPHIAAASERARANTQRRCRAAQQERHTCALRSEG
jgi:hypothetical protein